MAESIRKREEIEDRYKWDLTHIYPSDEAWKQAYDEATAHISRIAAYDGKVAEDPKGAIRTWQELIDEILPVYEYAFLRKETDNTDPIAQGLKDQAMRLYVTASTAGAFLQPELLSLPEEKLEAMMRDPEIKDFDATLRGVLLAKPHTLSKDQERLVAMMGEVAEAPDGIYTALTTADMKFPPVRMPDDDAGIEALATAGANGAVGAVDGIRAVEVRGHEPVARGGGQTHDERRAIADAPPVAKLA